MNQTTPEDRLYRIVREGLCIGCGICQSIAGSDKIEIAKVENGYQRPIVVGDLDHDDMDKIYDICPGTRVDGLPESEIRPETKIDNVWGPWRRMVRAFAADPKNRFEGATGGVLTALAQYLIRTERVKFILHARASETEPTFGQQQISLTEIDVFNSAGSRYGPTAILVDLEEVLARDEPFAFIGKPCDIAALRSFGRHDDRIGRLVKYWLTPVCGGFMPPDGMADFLQRHDLPADELTSFRYRGRGCPGPTRAETPDKVIEAHYLDLWGSDESKWNLPWRCKICPDGIGDAADIAASDTWIGGSPNRVDSQTDPGTNAVIARTTAGYELLADAERDGALSIEYDIAPDEVSIYQPHQMHKKYKIWARFQGLKDESCIVPETNRLRLKELADELPEWTNNYERKGTSNRVKIGRGAEDTPRRA